MRFIWVTRGRTWGFRFIDDGETPDPLNVYDRAFAGVADEPEAWVRSGANVALRFPDPLGRQDLAGRVIPHEFVVFPPEADQINSVDKGRDMVWPEIADEFSAVWDSLEPPSHT